MAQLLLFHQTHSAAAGSKHVMKHRLVDGAAPLSCPVAQPRSYWLGLRLGLLTSKATALAILYLPSVLMITTSFYGQIYCPRNGFLKTILRP
jgi:hypothetical protein